MHITNQMQSQMTYLEGAIIRIHNVCRASFYKMADFLSVTKQQRRMDLLIALLLNMSLYVTSSTLNMLVATTDSIGILMQT